MLCPILIQVVTSDYKRKIANAPTDNSLVILRFFRTMVNSAGVVWGGRAFRYTEEEIERARRA